MDNDLLLRLIKFLTAEEFGYQHNIKHPYLHEVFTHHTKGHPCEACDLLRELKAYVESSKYPVRGGVPLGGAHNSAAGGVKE